MRLRGSMRLSYRLDIDRRWRWVDLHDPRTDQSLYEPHDLANTLARSTFPSQALRTKQLGHR